MIMIQGSEGSFWMNRYDLTNFERWVIEPLLPNKPRGVPRVEDRRVLNGIFWVLRSGAPWRDLPERYCRARRVKIAFYGGGGRAFGTGGWMLLQRLMMASSR